MLSSTLAAAPPPRAVWIWEEDSFAIATDPAQTAAALELLTRKSVTTAYLYADDFKSRNLIQQNPATYRRVVAAMHARGIKVYALLGSAYLNTEAYIRPLQRRKAIAMFQRVLDYNASSHSNERFDGINVDIEPYLLDDWDKKKLELVGNYLDLAAAFMDLKAKSGQNLAVGPALPFWFDGIEVTWRGKKQSASNHVIDIYDYIAIMDYRDHAAGGDGIISHASDEMKYAATAGKKVVIGVDVSPGGLKKLSFVHLKEADMERELALAAEAFGGAAPFAGFAIHHFGTYRSWLSGQ
jgi:hypothetical protein